MFQVIQENEGEEGPGAGQSVPVLVEHCFRHAYGLLTARLSRLLGTAHRGVAEDLVQEALMRALRTWPFSGIPHNPVGWLQRTAHNLAIDHLRSAGVTRTTPLHEGHEHGAEPATPPHDPAGLRDDVLIHLVLCSNPILPVKPRLALTLKAVAGFSVQEISRALLMKESAVGQMITRAKERLDLIAEPFVYPPAAEMGERIESALFVLYLMFTEGHAATSGENHVRQDLCFEAIRLTRLLAAGRNTGTPEVEALAALMLALAARFPARTDANGTPVLLSRQDRTRWNTSMIAAALQHFSRASAGPVLTRYHLEAAIALTHTTAVRYEETDWAHIVEMYDLLIQLEPSPVLALNRVVALSHSRGPSAALEALEAIEHLERLSGYYLLPATLATIYRELGDHETARRHYREAIRLASSPTVRRFMHGRMDEM